MRRYANKIAAKVIASISDRIARHLIDSGLFADGIAYRVALERIAADLNGRDRPPNEVFSGISDDFWFWLNTEGYRRNQPLRSILPGMPDEDVQLTFTGNKGDAVLEEGFSAYGLFKTVYESHVGGLDHCNRILDFGCGWGRIIRFFIKDIDPTRLWGCDPVKEMINICKKHNKWCNFKKISTKPPTLFEDNAFDLIYGYSVFSHLSEEMHESWLVELSRILKPGGLLMMTTRNREFIELCAVLRKRPDFDSMHPGRKSSASAFLNTNEYLAEYDKGNYCFSQLVHEGEWSYWGETAIPKPYVLHHWTKYLTYIDYIDDKRCPSNQNFIVMGKAIGSNDGDSAAHS